MSLEDLSLEARDELAALAKKLADNPKTRKEFLRLTKSVNPDLPIPELEIEDRTTSALDQMRQENEAIRAKLREKEAMETLEKRRNALMKKGLIQSEDDIPQVEKVMLDKKIADHETAAEYWQWMKQTAEPTASSYQPNTMSKWDLSKFMKNPVGAARDEAFKALHELRKPNRPIGL
jgi:hypothetical protein